MDMYIQKILNLLKGKTISKETAYTLIKEYSKHKMTESNNEGVNEPVAIIGVSCRMPQADSKEQFWSNLSNGVESVREFPENRRKDTDVYLSKIHPDLFVGDNIYWKSGYLDEVDKFDNDMFDIVPGEAKNMDPQQRIFLEVAYETFEDAGYAVEKIRGTNTGVYIGDCDNEYGQAIEDRTASTIPGNMTPFIASRINHSFDLRGPALAFSSTCSSSLVSVHYAVEGIRNGDCQMALAGAINLFLFPVDLNIDGAYTVGITSEEARCRAFDNQANGIARGEGGGAVLLKSLKSALEDGDHIYGLIIGNAINNDGLSSGLTAPNPVAQTEMLQHAWRKSNIDPRTISYIEAHGTGTKLGDPIEINAITQAFQPYTNDKQFCGIGSVKSNIGHLVSGASGIAGLIKAIMSLKHRQLAPTLHIEDPNAFIDFVNSPVYLVDQLQDVELDGFPMRIGVSAFGFNGTNAHVVLEEAPGLPVRESLPVRPYLFVLSAKTVEQLKVLVKRHIDYWSENPTVEIGDASYTVCTGREHHEKRLALLVIDQVDLLSQLIEIEQKLETTNTELLSFGNISSETTDLVEIAQRYLAGENIHWKAVFTGQKYRRIPLPTYPFARKRHWLDPESSKERTIRSFGHTPATIELVELGAEERILQMFTRILGITNLNENDNFFDLGGDSLMGMQVINLINKEFGVKLTYETLFSHATVKELTEIIQNEEESSYHSIEVQPEKDQYLASFAQRRLWILDQMQEDRKAYNMTQTVSIESAVDLEVFRQALELLVRRHESLRTVFVNQNGELYQKVLPNITLDYLNLDFQSQEHAELLAKEQLNASHHRPFDLEKGPLIRALIIQMEPSSYYFTIAMHHIISDGWSLEILISELLEYYDALLKERTPNVEILQVQYKDYSEWQNKKFVDNKLKVQEKYWLERFSTGVPVCEIPGDKQRPAIFTFEGDQCIFQIKPEIAQKIRNLSRQNQATLFMTLLSSVYTLMYRYTGQKDLIIGSPISGRSQVELKNIIGFFVNTLAHRVVLDPTMDVHHLIQSVRNNVLEAFEYQEFPFDLLVDKLPLERDTSRSPLFNINVVLQNVQFNKDSKHTLESLRVKKMENMKHITSKWDLEFDFTEEADGSIQVILEYYTGIYSDEMIKSLIDNYLTLLEAMTSNPKLSINDLEILDGNMKQEILKSGHSEMDILIPESTLHELFMEKALNYKDAVAIVSKLGKMTYGELDARSNQLARFLKEQYGIGSGAHVGIMYDHSPEMIISVLAVLKTGAAYVPLESKHPFQRIKMIVDVTKIQIVLSQEKYVNLLDKLQWSCVSLDSYICLDTYALEEYEGQEASVNHFMNEDMWNYVAEQSSNLIEGSGWVSSYTGDHFSNQEMDEYRNNVVNKLMPHLSSDSRVLEIGCGSGITLFGVAPFTGYYMGTDLSRTILERNRQYALEKGLDHVEFRHLQAHEINQLQQEQSYDLIIMNSVIHCFHGHHYLRKVIKMAISLLSDKGILFIGDVMDAELKDELIESLQDFKKINAGSGYKTKIDWESELFLTRDFFYDLQTEFPEIQAIEITKKSHTIENELTRFRYDVELMINKAEMLNSNGRQRKKNRHDLRDLTSVSAERLNVQVSPSEAAYILFTSGSTSKPKGVIVEHRSVVNYIYWGIEYYFERVGQNPVFPVYSSLGFDLTVTSIFSPLLQGATITIYNGEFEEIVQGICSNSLNNTIKLTPAHLAFMMHSGENIRNLRNYIVGGETLNSSLVQKLFEDDQAYDHELRLYNEYGPTEATVGCIVYEINKHNVGNLKANVPIGRPISHTSIYILDDQLRLAPFGAVGEIAISGKCLARGYFNNSVLTDEKFIKNPYGLDEDERMYLTGDLGRLLPNGCFEFLGRKDRQVKVNAYRIELDEIERQLTDHEDIHEVHVIEQLDHTNTKLLCAYYCSDELLAPNELQEFLAKTLPDYMIPSFFIRMEIIPLTINGKVDRTKLPLPQELIELGEDYVAPTTEVETKLANIWAEVLNVERVGIKDDFFRFGGNSIKAIQVIPKAKATGLHLTVKDMFQYRTISELVAHANLSKSIIAVPEEEVVGDIPFSPIQKWFIEQQQPHSNYFNMGHLFTLPDDVDTELLEQVFERLIEHHDILRTHYKVSGDDWNQFNRSMEDTPVFHLEHVDFSDEQDSVHQEEFIVNWGNNWQMELDLNHDLLIKAAVLNLGKKGKRLLIIVHHLLFDGVSWRILIEDIEFLYRTKLEQALPPKTTSFKEWSEELQKIALTNKIDTAYWEKIDQSKIRNLPQIQLNKSQQVTFETVVITLEQESTSKIMELSTKVLGVSFETILLHALLEASTDLFDTQGLLFNLEGHGREEIIENVDLSRTIGWFTSIFPVYLEKQQSVQESIQHVDQTLSQLPYHGLMYGISRYLTNQHSLPDLQPQILFNYFGEMREAIKNDTGLLCDASEYFGSVWHPSNRCSHVMEINSIIDVHGRLQLSIEFNSGYLSPDIIQRFENIFKYKLSTLDISVLS